MGKRLRFISDDCWTLPTERPTPPPPNASQYEPETAQSAPHPAPVPSASVPAASAPPASVPAASVPAASVPAASVPRASMPPASMPPASVPPAPVPQAPVPPAPMPQAPVPPAPMALTPEHASTEPTTPKPAGPPQAPVRRLRPAWAKAWSLARRLRANRVRLAAGEGSKSLSRTARQGSKARRKPSKRRTKARLKLARRFVALMLRAAGNRAVAGALPADAVVSSTPEEVKSALKAAADEHARDPSKPRRMVVFEITNKVMGDFFFLRPDDEVHDIIRGVLGRALKLTGVAFYCGHVLSNHLSILVGVETLSQLADFTQRLFQQTSVRLRKHLGLNTVLWAGGHHAIVLTGDAAIQAARAKYCLSNGTKEHLVAHPSQWPGTHSARFFCNHEEMVGHWTDHTAYGRAKRRDPSARIEDFKIRYVIPHAQLPGFAHLNDAEYRAMMRNLCDEAAAEAAAVRLKDQLPAPAGPEAMRRVELNHRPEDPARSAQPSIHTLDPEAKRRHRAAYKAYVAQHQATRAELRAHLKAKGVEFPGGLLPTGWERVDPASVVPHPAVSLPEVSSAAD